MLSSPRKLLKRQINTLLVVVFITGCAFAQGPALSLASGSAVKGGSLSLNLSLSAATGAPSGLQWTLSYPATDITTISVVAGPALTAASKTLTCITGAGSVTCLAMGMNAATISSGVVAVVTATVSPNASSSQDPLPLSNVMGTLMDGTLLGVSGTGGVISVAQGALPTVSSLQCAPTTIASSSTSACTVKLSGPAPSGGSVVTLSNTNAALTVPSSVTVASGATLATFNATTAALASNQSATLTATYNGSSASATLNLTAGPTLISSLACSPTILGSNSSSSCTITLMGPASSGGVTVGLANDNTALTVPSSVNVPVGSTTASFDVTVGTVTSNQSAKITASLNGSTATASLTLGTATASPLAAYTFDAGSGSAAADASGHGITGTIQGAAWTTKGKNGNALSFNGSSSYVDLGNPASFQSAGSMTWSAWVNAAGNPGDDGQIVAQSDDASGWQFKTSADTGVRTFGIAIGANGSHTQRNSNTVLALNTWYHVAGVYNATTQSLDIYVNGVLDNGVLRGTVPSSQVLAGLNATVGKRSGGYYFNGVIDNLRIYNRALSASEIQIDMSTPADSTGAPAVTLQSLQCSPTALAAGGSSTCTVTVSSASTSPSLVAISDNNAALTVPTSVSVAAGSATASFTATAGSVVAAQTATVAASLNGSSATASVTIAAAPVPIVVSSLQCSPTSVTSGGTSTCTVTLSATSTASVSVAITDNSTALGVPASVTVAAGSTTAKFTATAGSVSANQTATVTATLNGSSKTASVTVTPVAMTVSQLQCAPTSVTSGGTSTCTVTLSATSTASVSVAITDNSTALGVPASVTVAAGSTTAKFTATAGSVSANQTATVTATFNGSSKTASVTVTPVAMTVSQL